MDKKDKSQKGAALMDIQQYKDIFDKYGGMMRTKDLEREKSDIEMSSSLSRQAW